MKDESKRRRVDPPAREAPGGDVDDCAPGGGGPGLVSMALFQKLEELLKATRSELAQTKEELAAAKATIAEYAEMHPTFDVNEDVASVVFSHVTDVRTRVALAQVNTVWRKASKVASSLPASLDFTGCPNKLNEEKTWFMKDEYVLGIEGVLDLPDAHFHRLLEDAGADLTSLGVQCNLGLFYEVAKRYDKALDWYHRGARQGCEACECNIGNSYYYGHGVERNIDTALEWYTKAAEKGHALAQHKVGVIHHEKGQHVEAFKWFKKAAIQGIIQAEYNLGKCYEDGLGVDKNIPKAVKWYTKAAEQGHAPAQNKVGCIHHDKEQYDEAFKWYMKAANQGFTDAEINLGIYYEDGLGVEKNIPEAIKWYAKAAEKGDTYAAEVLEELTSRE
jgi:tetratricopeptide (TPR) repeat protein